MIKSPTPSVEVTYGWVVIISSLVLHSISLGAPNILFVSLKPIAFDLNSPRWVPSVAYSFMMVGTGVGGILMGLWMDKRGILQPVAFGSLMIAIGAFVASFSQDRWGLWVANGILIGLFGKSAMIVPLIANATRWFDRRRGLAVAIITSAQGISGSLWPPIIEFLNTSVGWRTTYLYFSILVLCTMLPLAWLIRPKPPVSIDEKPNLTEEEDGLLMGLSPNLVQGLLLVAVLGCCSAMAVPIVHLVSHATDLGHAADRAAELLTVLMFAAIFSRLAFGILADRIGALPTLLIGSASQALMMFVFIWVENLSSLYIAAVLFGLAFSGIMPCYPLILRIWFPVKQIGWRIGAQYMFAAFGMALGGWIAGYLHDLTGSYFVSFMSGLAFNIMNLAIVAGLFFRSNRFGIKQLPA